MIKKYGLLTLAGTALLLSACSAFTDDEAPPLPGERISVLELQKSLEPDDSELSAQGLITPPEWSNEYWPQAGGYPNHSMQNLALSGDSLKRVWSSKIGDGATDSLPLTAQPVVIDGRIFTLDTEAYLSAFDIQNGKRLWHKDMKEKDEDDAVIGGGIAFAEGYLFITNGFNEILAVNPNDGIIVWRKKIPGPARAAPTVMNGRIFVTTLDSRILALDSRDGTALWEYQGIQETAGLVGAASPAANNDIVVAGFSSGEVSALRVANGSVAWSDSLSNVRNFGGLSSIADIKASPVIDKGIVFAVSFNGRLIAIDERTGTRIWQREIGGTQIPWLAGNHLFVLSNENQVVALGRDTGAIRWVTELPRYKDEEPILFTGPILAGGRLILAGTDGRVFEINPENGEISSQWDAGETISIAPVIAGGTLYILANNGTLSAYR